jgi:hypothetical protein
MSHSPLKPGIVGLGRSGIKGVILTVPNRQQLPMAEQVARDALKSIDRKGQAVRIADVIEETRRKLPRAA